MYGKKKYAIVLVAIILAVILLTGSAGRQNMYEELPQEAYEDEMEWAHRPAIDLEKQENYYSTINIDEPPTKAELKG